MSSPPDRTSCVPITLAITSELPTTAVAGQPLALSAFVEELPGHDPHVGGEVWFLVADPVAPYYVSTTTDASGIARAVLTPVKAGTFTLKAVAFGTASPSISQSLTVSPAITALSPVAAPAVATVWLPVEASAVLTRVSAPAGPLAGAPLRFVLTDSLGHTTTTTRFTDATGRATVSLVPPAAGPMSVAAYFDGSDAAVASAAAPASSVAYLRTFLRLLSVQPTLLEARLTAFDGGEPIGGAVVTFDGWPGGPVTAVTDAGGYARAPVALPAGTFTITASFLDLAGYRADQDGALLPTTAARRYPEPCGPGFEPAADLTTCVPAPSAARSSAAGSGLTTAMVGIPSLFAVIVRDANGVQLDHGIGCGRVTARITGTEELAPICTDSGDGTLYFIYTARIAGSYALAIRVDGDAIIGAPFALIGA